jgi:hypothetical protein
LKFCLFELSASIPLFSLHRLLPSSFYPSKSSIIARVLRYFQVEQFLSSQYKQLEGIQSVSYNTVRLNYLFVLNQLCSALL